jgi:hypothetical protein
LLKNISLDFNKNPKMMTKKKAKKNPNEMKLLDDIYKLDIFYFPYCSKKSIGLVRIRVFKTITFLRMDQQQQEDLILELQRIIRGFLCRKRFYNEIRFFFSNKIYS